MNHTPGPWEVTKYTPDNKRWIYGVRNAGFGSPNPYPADPLLGTSWRTENEADACLIAAAPDLLAACKLSLRNAESIIYQQPATIEDSVELKSLRTWRDTLKTAIAKAEGGG